MEENPGKPNLPHQNPLRVIVDQYPAITLLADASSYSEVSHEVEDLSGEQLRTAKSIAITRKMAVGDTASLLGGQAETLQPGYAIYSDIVREGFTMLGEGNPTLGQSRMESALSVHDLVKSAFVTSVVVDAYGTTDHDMGFARLVADNFRALEGSIDTNILNDLRSTISGDVVLRNFFAKERGIDPGFNVGRHLQGEADFTLFQKTVHEIDPVTMAEFILDLLGGDGNTNPNGPVKFSDIPSAFNGIAMGLKKLMAAQGRASSAKDLYATWQELSYPQADLSRLGLNRSTPKDIAFTRIAFMGREHQKGDVDHAHKDIASLGTSFDRLDIGSGQEIIGALQDNAGLDLGFAPHVMEALRQKIGAGAAYKHLLSIITQVCESGVVRSRPIGESLTVNLNKKFDWTGITYMSNIRVIVTEHDANGVVNADFRI